MKEFHPITLTNLDQTKAQPMSRTLDDKNTIQPPSRYTYPRGPLNVFKLTNQYHKTRHSTQWGENFTHNTCGFSTYLCNNQWLHFYDDPLLAALLHPAHVSFQNPILWTAKAEGTILLQHGIKGGCTKLTTQKIIPLPPIPNPNRIQFAATIALHLELDEYWNDWLRRVIENPGPPVPIPIYNLDLPPDPIAPLYKVSRYHIVPNEEHYAAAETIDRTQSVLVQLRRPLPLVQLAREFFKGTRPTQTTKDHTHESL